MAPLITQTRAALRERREAVYARLGLTAAEFEKLTDTQTLTSAEWDARDELDEIAFLLGDTKGE